MLLPVLAGCADSHREVPVEIRFEAAAGVELRNLQFYLHDIELVDGKSVAHPLRIEGPVALIDLTGAPGARSASVRGRLAGESSTDFRALRFTVGVPFALNHANPLTAAPPLDRGELFWAWQNGYKFLRADFATQGTEASFHLGSTGCSSASSLRPPASRCAQPNLVRVELAGNALNAVVRFHPAELGTGICTGNYATDPACAAGYAATGLEATTGECAGGVCRMQRLWSLD